MRYQWENLADEQLLKLRFCDLALKLEDTGLYSYVERLRQELLEKGLKFFKVKVYLGDEWFSPEGVPAVSVPFFLAHPRLKALEKKFMFEVEGENAEYFMKLLRHEVGHCFDHAYRFSGRSKWKRLFGSSKEIYSPETYRPRPYSRSYVHNLENWYAQAHPDEDFAETFAVWLDPESDWRKKYAQWPKVFEKLEYIEQLAREVVAKKPKVSSGPLNSSIQRMKTTLEKYYLKKKKNFAEDYPEFYDVDLRRVFQGEIDQKNMSASQFMRRNRKKIVESVSYWSGEKKYTVDLLVKKLILRTDVLGLRLDENSEKTNFELASYLTSLVTHYLFTGRFKRSV